jgi:hypothetical protein
LKILVNHLSTSLKDLLLPTALLLVLWMTRLGALDLLPLHNDEGLHLTRAVEVWNGHPFWAISDGKIVNHWVIAAFYPQHAPAFAGGGNRDRIRGDDWSGGWVCTGEANERHAGRGNGRGAVDLFAVSVLLRAASVQRCRGRGVGGAGAGVRVPRSSAKPNFALTGTDRAGNRHSHAVQVHGRAVCVGNCCDHPLRGKQGMEDAAARSRRERRPAS